MTFEEISEKAFKREELGSCKNLAEKYAYIQLFNLYRDYFNKNITKEKAAIIKADIKKEFEDNQRKIERYYENLRHREEIKGKYTNYITAVEKSKSQDDILYNSLKFIEAIIQDDSFAERNLGKVFDNKNNL